MDTSELYIKMCDCPEIQDKWQFNDGDFHVNLEIHGRIIDVINNKNKPDFNESGYIWLPRQDQIQEMLGNFIWTNVLMERCFKGEYPSEWPMDTWEKRWLHLYMQVKHNKIWDGKEKKWIKK